MDSEARRKSISDAFERGDDVDAIAIGTLFRSASSFVFLGPEEGEHVLLADGTDPSAWLVEGWAIFLVRDLGEMQVGGRRRRQTQKLVLVEKYDGHERFYAWVDLSGDTTSDVDRALVGSDDRVFDSTDFRKAARLAVSIANGAAHVQSPSS